MVFYKVASVWVKAEKTCDIPQKCTTQHHKKVAHITRSLQKGLEPYYVSHRHTHTQGFSLDCSECTYVDRADSHQMTISRIEFTIESRYVHTCMRISETKDTYIFQSTCCCSSAEEVVCTGCVALSSQDLTVLHSRQTVFKV